VGEFFAVEIIGLLVLLGIVAYGVLVTLFIAAHVLESALSIVRAIYLPIRARLRGNRIIWLAPLGDCFEEDRQTGQIQPSDRQLREMWKRNQL